MVCPLAIHFHSRSGEDAVEPDPRGRMPDRFHAFRLHAIDADGRNHHKADQRSFRAARILDAVAAKPRARNGAGGESDARRERSAGSSGREVGNERGRRSCLRAEASARSAAGIRADQAPDQANDPRIGSGCTGWSPHPARQGRLPDIEPAGRSRADGMHAGGMTHGPGAGDRGRRPRSRCAQVKPVLASMLPAGQSQA